MLPDDFGAGGVSLFHLKRYPVQTLKIECSLVRGIGAETSNSPIVSAIISLAHNLKMRVIAKGIEAQEELAFLQSAT